MYLVNPILGSPRARPRTMRGLGSLGDSSSSSVQVDSSSVLNVGDDLRAAQARITNLFQQMQGNPDLTAAIGRSLTQQQSDLSDLISKYVGVYTAIFGQAPVGLGQAVILISAGAAVVLGIVIAGLVVWKQKQDALEQQAQAQVQAEANRTAMINMAAQQQTQAAQQAAAGDTAGAATSQATALQILQDAGAPGTSPAASAAAPQSFGQWFAANWVSVAAVTAAIVVLPKLIER